jgi:hypothetical protein
VNKYYLVCLQTPYGPTRMNVMEMMQKQFQEAAEKLQTVQKEYSKGLADRQTLDSQLNENKQVRCSVGRSSVKPYLAIQNYRIGSLNFVFGAVHPVQNSVYSTSIF